MKKSIMRATLPHPSRQPLIKILDTIRKAGFEGIQLGVMEPVGELTLRTPDGDVAKLRKACIDAGLEPHSIVGGFRFLQEGEAERKRHIEAAKRTLDIAALLGARTILVHPGQLTTAVPYDACWRYAREGLLALKEKAEASHIRLGLENVWNKFLLSPMEFRRFLDDINSPQIGIWFDIGNVVAFAYPEQWLRILGAQHLVGIHMKDFRRGPFGHFGTADHFMPLLHGDVNWPAVMQELRALKFDDYLVSESSLGRQPLAEGLKEISAQLDAIMAKAPQ